MAYRPAAPPDKGFFVEITDYSSSLSSPKNTGYTGYKVTIDAIIDDRTVAVLIDSQALGSLLWFAFDRDFDPADGIPVFYADELDLLKDKPLATLQKIYETKKTFGPGTRVRQ